MAARKASRVRVPFPWVGTGQLVYGGFLYYARRPPGGPGGGGELQNTLQLIKFHLANRTVVDSSVFPAEGLIPPYGLTADTYIDLAADEEGLWAVYATREDDRHLCLAKLDPQTLDTEQQWDTPCPRENAEAAFVICGTLYVVYNTRPASRARIQCSFDASGTLTPERAALPYFPRRYGAHASLRYNPRDRGPLFLMRRLADAEKVGKRLKVRVSICWEWGAPAPAGRSSSCVWNPRVFGLESQDALPLATRMET